MYQPSHGYIYITDRSEKERTLEKRVIMKAVCFCSLCFDCSRSPRDENCEASRRRSVTLNNAKVAAFVTEI